MTWVIRKIFTNGSGGEDVACVWPRESWRLAQRLLVDFERDDFTCRYVTQCRGGK
jgi:hypothetical protein